MRFGIFFFDGAEAIDVATLGVLSIAKRIVPELTFFSFAPKAGIVNMANGFKIVADHGIDDLPPVDAIVITGGATWTEQIKDQAVLEFFRQRAKQDTVIGSVCTGGMILGATGLLDGKQATTRFEGIKDENLPFKRMANMYPEINVVHSSIVDQGTIVTGGGVCLCIDMMLHLLERKYGSAVANDIARLLEYKRAWEANKAALPPVGLAA